MIKKRAYLILVLILAFCISFNLSSALPVYVKPLNASSNLQPNTLFNYTFNFTTNIDCSGVVLTKSYVIQTGEDGIGFAEVDVSTMSSIPKYLCEYKNGALRKNHTLSDQVLWTIYAQSASFNGNVSADWFKGKVNWSDVQNAPITTWTSTYNSTYDAQSGRIDSINSTINSNSANWSSTYNSTYAQMLNQQCPSGLVVNGTLPNGTFICTTAPGDGSYNATYDAYVTANYTNKSNYWDNMDTINSTQMESSGGALTILVSWLTDFVNSWLGGKTTDNLAQGTTNLYDNRSWNETRANALYLTLTDQRYNETSAIISINTTQNIQALGFYNKTEIDNNFTYYLLETDQRFNETNLINAINTTQNIMNLGFYNKSETDTNLSLRLLATDQRYNETSIINSVNTTINIQNLGFYNKTEVDNNFTKYYTKSEVDNNLTLYLLVTDQRFNETAVINSINTTANIQALSFYTKAEVDNNLSNYMLLTDQRYNETSMILSVNTTNNIRSLGFFNFSGALSELTNDIGFITVSVSTLLNYYTKAEVYNKTESTDIFYNKSNPSGFISSYTETDPSWTGNSSEVARYQFGNNNFNGSGNIATTGTATIGTSTDNFLFSGAQLNMSATGAGLNRMLLQTGSFGTIIRSLDNDAGDGIAFQSVSGTTIMYLRDDNKRVGIGTTAPGSTFEVAGNITAQGLNITVPGYSPYEIKKSTNANVTKLIIEDYFAGTYYGIAYVNDSQGFRRIRGNISQYV